jgi:hypothetical protein
MITTVVREVQHCRCEVCAWEWESLTDPQKCPRCTSRMWNGAKPRGRPRGKAKKKRKSKKELVEYAKDW